MTSAQHAVLLVGSPRGAKSTSASLGTYLLEQLAARGLTTDQVLVYRALRAADGRASMLAAVEAAHLVVFAFPLYYDSLPAPAISALEMVAAERRAGRPQKAQRFVAVVNGGFPEARQSDTALAICRQFAREAGLTWAGGLALAGGGAIDGKPLREAGGMVRGVCRALDLAAAALAEGQPIPEQAVSLMARPFIPAWLYRWMADLGFRQQARRNGVGARLRDRPYEG